MPTRAPAPKDDCLLVARNEEPQVAIPGLLETPGQSQGESERKHFEEDLGRGVWAVREDGGDREKERE